MAEKDFYTVENPMASLGFDITPDDSNDLSQVSKGVYVGTGGDLKVDMKDGGTVTFVNISSGTFMPIIISKVYATGTDATDIIGFAY